MIQTHFLSRLKNQFQRDKKLEEKVLEMSKRLIQMIKIQRKKVQKTLKIIN